MGKALPSVQKFQPGSAGARAPQSFRSGIVAAENGLLTLHQEQIAANEVAHPLRDGVAAEQEDAFWHDAYTRESYYVSGRGYDQYRPAYALGWQAAFDYASLQFSEVEPTLERDWEAQDTHSLLEWVQVRDAVYAAWVRGRSRLIAEQPVMLPSQQLMALRPLRHQLVQLARNLSFLLSHIDPPPSAFMRQVIDRHVQVLTELAQEFPEDSGHIGLDAVEPFRRIAATVHHGWLRLKTLCFDVDTAQLLQFCDRNEAALREMYRDLQSHSLSPELASLLLRQQQRLQLHHSKLQWVRQHWSEQS